MVVNRLITREISQPIASIVATSHAIAAGDLSQELQVTRRDEIGELADAFRHMRTTIRAVLKETDRLTHAIQAGQLTVRGKPETFQGEWRELVQGINEVVDAFVIPFTVTAKVIDRIAGEPTPYKMAKPRIERELRREKRSALQEEWIADLRSKHPVTIFENTLKREFGFEE